MGPNFFMHMVNLWVYGIVGILLMFVGYKLFDLFLTKIDFCKELVENKNMAVAVMVASIILGVSAIAVAVIVS